MHEVATSKNWHLPRMHEVVICTSGEHDWGSHIGCNFDRMFVGAIWSGSAEAHEMSFEELLDQACISARLPEMARLLLPSTLSEEIKNAVMNSSPEDLGAILKAAIDEINRGSVESVDALVRKALYD